MRKSDTGIFVGKLCEVCGERVNISDNSGFYSVHPDTQAVTAWHMKCRPVFRFFPLIEEGEA